MSPFPGARSGSAVFGGVFLVALLIRLTYLFQFKDATVFTVLVGDGLVYDEWARRIAGGNWLGREVFYQAPLYPYFLAVLYTLFGHDLLVVRLVQALLGATGCGLLALAGRRFFSDRAGVIAGLFIACYGPALFYEGLIQKTALDGFFMSLLLLLLAGGLDSFGGGRALALGLVLGGLSLSRENALILVPLIGFWLWRFFDGASVRTRLRAMGLFALGLGLILAPVAGRNYLLGGEWFITTAQFGPNFYIGNNAKADGRYTPLQPGRGDARMERQDATRLAQEALRQPLSPGEVSAYWTGQALAYIGEHPLAWLALLGKKILRVWNVAELTDTEEPEVYADESWLLRGLYAIFNFGTLAPVALAGIVLTWSQRRRSWLLYFMLGGMTAGIALFYVFGRYRYVLVPILMLFAGAALAHAFDWARRREAVQLLPAGAVLIGAVILVHWKLLPADVPRAATYYNLGVRLSRDRKFNEALMEYAKAHALAPSSPEVNSMMGDALAALGRYEEAVAHYRTTLRLRPEDAIAHFALGRALAQQGNTEAAIVEFQEALRLNPNLTDARIGLAAAQSQRAGP
jgi:tetratricopeptide (TPR) repeat protein